MNTSVRTRLVAWYVPALGALGIAPYWAVLLDERGLSGPAISLVMMAFPATTLLAGPLWGWLADRTGAARGLLVAMAVGSALTVLLPGVAAGAAAGVGVMVFALLHTPQTPLVDALAVRALPGGGRDYGPVRLWGSIAFLVIAVSVGFLRDVWPSAPILVASGLLGVSAFTASRLPSLPPTPRPSLPALIRAVRGLDAFLLLTAFVLHGVGLAFYNVFFARLVEGRGHPDWVTGLAIGLAVGVEVVVMRVAPRLLGRAPALVWVVVAMLVSAPRWWATSTAESAFSLIAWQALHGATFGLFWIGAVPAVADRAEPAVARSVQALLPASAFGLGPLIALGVASVALGRGDPGTLFAIATGTSLAASTLGAVLLLRPAVTPSGSRPRPPEAPAR
jgi:PPP family 3-phenylpropionic acid transporter